MADPALSNRPASYVALGLFVSFVGLIVYGVYRHVNLGMLIYGVGLASFVLGFFSKEDAIAMGSIVLLNLLVMLDIFMGIGLLPSHG
jgi:hypothetical protein